MANILAGVRMMQPFNPLSTLTAGEQLRGLQNQNALAPLRREQMEAQNQLLQGRNALNQSNMQAQERQAAAERMRARAIRGRTSANPRAFVTTVGGSPEVAADLEMLGIPLDFDAIADMPDEQLMQELASAEQVFTQMSGRNALMPAGVREFNALTEGLSAEDVERARRIQLGLDPRAGMSARERIALNDSLTADVAESEAEITGAKRAAEEEAKQAAEVTKQERDNARTLNMWDGARASLMAALSGTNTGPLVGRGPALTADAQTAEGAVAAVAPVLKQLFRSAGEGVFTDKDQELLLGMIPTRVDLPEARENKMRMVDSIIQAKLGAPGYAPLQQNEQALDLARQAIEAGKDRTAVIQRLLENNIDPAGL